MQKAELRGDGNHAEKSSVLSQDSPHSSRIMLTGNKTADERQGKRLLIAGSILPSCQYYRFIPKHGLKKMRHNHINTATINQIKGGKHRRRRRNRNIQNTTHYQKC